MRQRPLRILHLTAGADVVRLGFRDGRAGWHLSRLMPTREYTIGLLYDDKLLRQEYGRTQMSPESRDRRLGQRMAVNAK
jgi:hypothetical protein